MYKFSNSVADITLLFHVRFSFSLSLRTPALMATVWDLAFVCTEPVEAVFVSKRKLKCLLNALDMALPIFKEHVHKEKRIFT